MNSARLNEVSGEVIDAAIKVHKALGPGLLESAYQACLLFELHRRGLKANKEVELPVVYEGVRIDCGYRIDILVEQALVIEIKAVKQTLPVHEAQVLSYLKLGDFRLGLLINFHVLLMKDGIKRMVNKLD